MTDVDYSQCTFEARLEKEHLLRRREHFYLYVSPTRIIINTEPYSRKPYSIVELTATTHVKWLWEARTLPPRLRGFIIETEGQMHQFVAERIVLETLKLQLQSITLQSEFYEEYVLGKYLLSNCRYIDKGNYAQVYECTKKGYAKKYAVKVLEKERLKTIKNGKESVFNELKVLRNLNHPNLMKLFEVYEDRTRRSDTQEVNTKPHERYNTKDLGVPFEQHEIKSIMKQLLSALGYLLEVNIMHRDVKPENILFEKRGQLLEGLKLVDYGLATYQHESNIIFTKCGTPGFVAPEIISYDEKEAIYEANVDTFSAGVIMHILLLHEQCFKAKSRNTILNRNKECKFDFKHKLYDQLGIDALDLLSRLLEKNPVKRIKPREALTHPFFTKDKPIYKFKKAAERNHRIGEMYSVSRFKNLEDCEEEGDLKGKVNYARSIVLQYDPFGYEKQEQTNINLGLGIKIGKHLHNKEKNYYASENQAETKEEEKTNNKKENKINLSTLEFKERKENKYFDLFRYL